MKIIAILLFSSLFSLCSCTSADTTDSGQTSINTEQNIKDQQAVAKNITIAEFEEIMKTKKPLIVDVRTTQEVSEGKIDGSINIDIISPDFLKNMQKLEAEDKAIVLYCRSGQRSAQAMKMLKKAGYKETYNLLGGFNEYSKKK